MVHRSDLTQLRRITFIVQLIIKQESMVHGYFLNQMLSIDDFDMPFNEAEIDGQRIHYDACSSNTIEKAKEFYGDRYTYFGSSYVTYHNGVKNQWDELHHFFKYSEPAPEACDATQAQ